MTTKADQAWLDAVASLPCATCGAHGVHVHHIRTGQGKSQRASHYLTLPLCPSCHTGPQGVHGNKTMMRILKTDELGLLAEVIPKVVLRLK